MKQKAIYADTPTGNYTLGPPEDYRCSNEFRGAGMDFAIPVRGRPGLYLHGIDDKGLKEKDVIAGIPASAGCVRLVDSIACQLYATIKQCNRSKFSFNVVGQYPTDDAHKVRDSSGELVQAQKRDEALAEAEERRMRILRSKNEAPQ